MMTMRNNDQRILRAFGINLVIAGKASAELCKLARIQEDGTDLYLYEILDVNLGRWSPKQILIRDTLDTMLDTVADRYTDLKTTAILEEETSPGPLVSVQKANWTVHKDGQDI